MGSGVDLFRRKNIRSDRGFVSYIHEHYIYGHVLVIKLLTMFKQTRRGFSVMCRFRGRPARGVVRPDRPS